MKRYAWIVVVCVLILVAVGVAETWMGRLPFGPDGMFGFWEPDIWSPEQSQRVADPYSLSHVLHGFFFYLFLWVVARKLPVRYRFLGAIILEAAWEVLENSSLIISRYRDSTASIGYVGDSVLNSISDIFFMAIGFALASKLRIGILIAIVIGSEFLMLALVRDNLTLNIIMLIYPIDAIKAWQSALQPPI